MSVPMTFSDLERRDARGQIFHADLLGKARIV